MQKKRLKGENMAKGYIPRSRRGQSCFCVKFYCEHKLFHPLEKEKSKCQYKSYRGKELIFTSMHKHYIENFYFNLLNIFKLRKLLGRCTFL